MVNICISCDSTEYYAKGYCKKCHDAKVKKCEHCDYIDTPYFLRIHREFSHGETQNLEIMGSK